MTCGDPAGQLPRNGQIGKTDPAVAEQKTADTFSGLLEVNECWGLGGGEVPQGRDVP
jgi:hypothetical protein